MLDGQIATFIIVAAVVTIVPGVDTMLVIRNVLRGGVRDGVTTTFGINCGLFVHAACSALGVSILLKHSADAFQILKLAGAAYLVWLGVQSLRAALRGGEVATAAHFETPTRRAGYGRCLAEGFLSNVLNPKVAIFYLAFLPQFIRPDDPVVLKSLLLAGIHCVEGVLWLSIVANMIGRARRLFVDRNVKRWLDGACGAMFVGIGAHLAMAGK